MELELREYCLEEMFNRHSIPDSKLTDRAGNQVLVSKLTGKISGDAAKCENGMAERGILFWLEEDREPTVHILNEMMDLKENMKNTKTDYIYPSQRRIFKECYSGEMSGTVP